MRDFKRILFLRSGSIGNTIAAIPALRCVRSHFPSSRIGIVVSALGYELLRHCPFIDDAFIYDKQGGSAGMVAYFSIIHSVRKWRPDCIVQLKRFKRNGIIGLLSGARFRCGFRTNGSAPFLTHSLPYREDVHVYSQNIQLLSLLGITECSEVRSELHLTETELSEAREWLNEQGIVREFSVAHFGGVTSGAAFLSLSARASVLNELNHDGYSVLIGSGDSEQRDATSLASMVPNSLVACNLPLRRTMAVMYFSSLFIGTNSGPMHIAAALGKNGVAFFNGDEKFRNDIKKWRPQFDGLKIIPVTPASADLDLIRQVNIALKRA